MLKIPTPSSPPTYASINAFQDSIKELLTDVIVNDAYICNTTLAMKERYCIAANWSTYTDSKSLINLQTESIGVATSSVRADTGTAT